MSRSGWKKWQLACLVGVLLVAQSAVGAPTPIAEKGGFFATPRDLARLRAQASDPRLQVAYHHVKDLSDDAVQRWEKLLPPQSTLRTAAELLAFGRSRTERDPTYSAVAIECALDPTPKNKRVLREMMLLDLGWRQRLSYWNGMGIHEGIATSDFLESYDIGAQLNVFTPEDHAAIREEMHNAGHFFEDWLLNNTYSRMYLDKREEAFCLNFHVFSVSTLSWIAMIYPDFPESKVWLRKSEAALVEYLMNGFGEDGVYGEGCGCARSLSESSRTKVPSAHPIG